MCALIGRGAFQVIYPSEVDSTLRGAGYIFSGSKTISTSDPAFRTKFSMICGL